MQTREASVENDLNDAVETRTRVVTPLPPIPLDVVKMIFNQFTSFSNWQSAAVTDKAFNLFVKAGLMPQRLLQEKSVILPQLIASCLFSAVTMSFPRDRDNEKMARFKNLMQRLTECKTEYDANPLNEKFRAIVALVSDLLGDPLCQDLIAQITIIYDEVVINRYAIVTGFKNEVSAAPLVWKECFRANVNVMVKLEHLMTYLRELDEEHPRYAHYHQELNAVIESENLLINRCRAQLMVDLPMIAIRHNAQATFKVILDGMPLREFETITFDNNKVDYKEFFIGFILEYINLVDRECFHKAISVLFKKYPEIFHADENNFIVDAENNIICYNPLYLICQTICYKPFSGESTLMQLQYLENLATELINQGETLVSLACRDETSLSLLERSLSTLENEVLNNRDGDLEQANQDEQLLQKNRMEVMRKLCDHHYRLQPTCEQASVARINSAF